MPTGRGEWDDDVVDRIKASGATEPLLLEAMQEVVYLRGELAKLTRLVNQAKQRESLHANHKLRTD